MQKTMLKKMIYEKVKWIYSRKKRQPIVRFYKKIKSRLRNFYHELQVSSNKTVCIFECKQTSPSQGMLREDFDLVNISSIYKDNASVLSVLTDKEYFQGSLDFLSLVSKNVPHPVMCKEFIIDPYQIYLARYYQADAILLMLSLLNDEQYRKLSSIAHSLKMGILTEVSNEEELGRAITMKTRIIGINNRNLKDFCIDLNRTKILAQHVPKGVTVLSESGITNYHQIRKLRRYANGFLIGSAFMYEQNLRSMVHVLLLGENKICGIINAKNIIIACKYGAIYCGVIFISKSSRYVHIRQAREVMFCAHIKYVCVFLDIHIGSIVQTAEYMNVKFVQLHGKEKKYYINNLRIILQDYCNIWKAISVKKIFPMLSFQYIDRYLLDNGAGGTGHCFDWNLLYGANIRNFILSGGLGVENCVAASQFCLVGMDFNSCLEKNGIKKEKIIATIFLHLRSK